MKKILMVIAAALIGICAWWYGILTDVLWYGVDMINAVGSAFMDYIMPSHQGIRSYITSGYLTTRHYLGKIFGWQPLSIYDYILDRAKANPLEAFGAVAVVMVVAWLIRFKYRTLYRFYHWLLITRKKR
jgi:hypothetical protein